MLVMQENGCILIWNKPPVTTHEELIIFGHAWKIAKLLSKTIKDSRSFSSL